MKTCTDSIISNVRRCRKAFTLAEIMVTMVLIAIVASAAGVALNQGYFRTGKARATLIQLTKQSHVFQLLQNDLRWATQAHDISWDSISFTVPDITVVGDFELVTYHWNENNLQLSCQRNSGNPDVIAQDINNISFTEDTFTENETTYLRGITISIQFGSDENSTIERYIELINTPVFESSG